jgi:hypothetical protein
MASRKPVFRQKLARFAISLIMAACIGLLSWSALPAIATATQICRTIHQSDQPQVICIATIKRSAKNFWEYRAAIEVEGKQTPVELYNCRDRLIFRASGKVTPFSQDQAGALVCSLFDKQHAYR